MRQFGDQFEKITDPGLLAQVRRQAQGVWLKSFILSAVLTLLILLLPR